MVNKMSKVKITQTRSIIKRPKKQKDTMVALGLKKISHSVEVEDTSQIQGMVRKVSHLINVIKV
jgi:large subunit ribosomal protein L30